MLSLGVIAKSLEYWTLRQATFSFESCAVAFSGGADSTALLIALSQLAAQGKASFITAIHIHHGLQAAADAFDAHCARACAELSKQGVPVRYVCERVSIAMASGYSVEQRAREARYDALCAVSQRLNISTVLLAHHADDQAESLLLALSRGAGLAGLAGMAPAFERGGVRFARPLLDTPGTELKALANDSSLRFIEDPTNTDERYTRNKFRSQLMPAIAQTMPAFRETFARSARHAAEAQALLETVAAEDYQRVVSNIAAFDAPIDKAINSAISLKRIINELPPLRWPNVLRYWLKQVHQVTPSAAQLDELCAQIATSQRHGAPRRLHIKVANGFVQREGDLLGYETASKTK